MANKTRKDPNAVEIGARLRKFIDTYYVTNKRFAEVCGMNISVLSQYVNGTLLISDKTATKLQNIVGINKDYLFNGNDPMVLEDKLNPFRHLQANQFQFSQSKAPPTSDKSISNHYNIETRGSTAMLGFHVFVSIEDIIVGNLDAPNIVLIESPEFIEKYKNIFPLQLYCHILLDRTARSGDDVLVCIDGVLYLANMMAEITEQKDKGDCTIRITFTDCASKEELSFNQTKDEVLGAYYSTIIRGRLK